MGRILIYESQNGGHENMRDVKTCSENRGTYQGECGINVVQVMWAKHAWRKEYIKIKAVIKDDLTGKRPIDRLRLGWEDFMKKVVKIDNIVDPHPIANQKDVAENRERRLLHETKMYVPILYINHHYNNSIISKKKTKKNKTQ